MLSLKASAWEKYVSPRRKKTSQVVLFAGLFGLVGVFFFSPYPQSPSEIITAPQQGLGLETRWHMV